MTSFETRAVSGGLREIRVRAPGVSSIELMGDFNNWKPVSLRDAGSGWWITALPITTGIHEINVRVNGGQWVVPPGLPQKRDEFGSSVGVLVIQ
jgi:1,4-alpha-glucan branching enzyme